MQCLGWNHKGQNHWCLFYPPPHGGHNNTPGHVTGVCRVSASWRNNLEFSNEMGCPSLHQWSLHILGWPLYCRMDWEKAWPTWSPDITTTWHFPVRVYYRPGVCNKPLCSKGFVKSPDTVRNLETCATKCLQQSTMWHYKYLSTSLKQNTGWTLATPSAELMLKFITHVKQLGFLYLGHFASKPW